MKKEENNIDFCVECGKEMTDMEHNYGTKDTLVCIHCDQDAQIEIENNVFNPLKT